MSNDGTRHNLRLIAFQRRTFALIFFTHDTIATRQVSLFAPLPILPHFPQCTVAQYILNDFTENITFPPSFDPTSGFLTSFRTHMFHWRSLSTKLFAIIIFSFLNLTLYFTVSLIQRFIRTEYITSMTLCSSL